MALNMSAFRRHKILNRLFREAAANPALRKTKHQLISTIASETEMNPSLSTIEHDITAFKNDYDLEISRKKNSEGKITYAYTSPYTSIYDNNLSEEEAKTARMAIDRMTMYASQGMFHDIHSALPSLRKAFFMSSQKLSRLNKDAIYFEDVSMDVSWYELLPQLYSHIQNKCVLKILYKPYGGVIQEFDFHPHVLKQYNRRWFCFGLKHIHDFKPERENEFVGSVNLALDRIKKIEILTEKELNDRVHHRKEYIESTKDWDEYFDSIVGVTGPSEDSNEEEIEIWVSKKRANYVKTKPIHCSQISPKSNEDFIDINDEEGCIFKYSLYLNREFESKLLELGADCTVLKPESLRKSILEQLKKQIERY